VHALQRNAALHHPVQRDLTRVLRLRNSVVPVTTHKLLFSIGVYLLGVALSVAPYPWKATRHDVTVAIFWPLIVVVLMVLTIAYWIGVVIGGALRTRWKRRRF
jgi:VIT1/CCC1 family predicted Fe2+/Mn2+ transporter